MIWYWVDIYFVVLIIFPYSFLFCLDPDEPSVQKSSDTVYISGLGTEMSVKDLTAALVERFSTIGVLKIDKKTMEPKSKPHQDNMWRSKVIQVSRRCIASINSYF